MRDPEEQRVIALVRRLYASGMTMRQVATELEARKIFNRRGRPFPLSRVHEIIHADRKPPPEAEG